MEKKEDPRGVIKTHSVNIYNMNFPEKKKQEESKDEPFGSLTVDQIDDEYEVTDKDFDKNYMETSDGKSITLD